VEKVEVTGTIEVTEQATLVGGVRIHCEKKGQADICSAVKAGNILVTYSNKQLHEIVNNNINKIR